MGRHFITILYKSIPLNGFEIALTDRKPIEFLGNALSTVVNCYSAALSRKKNTIHLKSEQM